MTSGAKFERIPAGNKPFASAFQEAVDELERITPSEKAMSVPFLKIWEIDPSSGMPRNPGSEKSIPKRPLSSQLVEPPKFGASSDVIFRERPDVSLERVIVKYNNPRDIFSYRQFQLMFIVHRPDVVFEKSINGEDCWARLLIPDAVFALEYGWTSSKGVKNSLLNGDGLRSSLGSVVPALQSMRFKPSNYTFKMNADGSMSFTVFALEDGEFNFRQASIGLHSLAESLLDPASWAVNEPFGRDSGQLKILRDALHKQLSDSKTKVASKGETVSISKVFNVLFAPLFEKAYTNLGYSSKKLFIGDLNDRAGQPSSRYSKGGSNWIGDFQVPLQDVEDIFSKNVKIGEQMTLQNFIRPFLEIFQTSETWDRTSSKKDKDDEQSEMMPRVVIRSVTNRDRDNKLSVSVYIFDAKHEFVTVTKSNKDGQDDFIGTNGSKSDLKKKLRDKNIPYISLLKGNAYIRDASFDVTMDDAMKSLKINQVFGQKGTRINFTGSPEISGKINSAPDASQFIYSGAITGDIPMIGNFAFDIFQLIWIDFGVKAWSGLFSIMSREDTLERGDFSTKLKVVSTGTDPFGTQGRKSKGFRKESQGSR